MKTSSDKTCLRHLRLAGLEPAFPNLAGGLSIPYPLAHNSLKPYSNMSTFLIKKLKVMERGRRFGVHKTPLGSSVSQDHTSQDHFCSLIDEFLTRNVDSDPPRWRVETTGSQRETVEEWTRSPRVPFHDIEDRSACLNICRLVSRVLSGLCT